MKLSHLQNYLQVVRRGSFSAAARATGVSQSAVSQQITALEKELGATLLIRGVRGVLSLTPAGEVLLKYAESTLTEYEAMCQEISSLQNAVKGPLNLAASAIPGNYLLPELIMLFQERYPDIDVRLGVANTLDVTRKLQARECEIGFIGAPMELPDHVVEPWVEDKIVLAVYGQHPFASRGTVALEELEGEALIVREEGSGTRRTVERLLREQGWPLSRFKVVLVLGSTQGVANAIRGGLGIGFMSTHAARSGDLSVIRVSGLDLTRELYIAYEPGRVQTGSCQAFLDFVRARAPTAASAS